jgi:hypothetical protein
MSRVGVRWLATLLFVLAASLQSAIVAGDALILDPSISLEGNTIDAVGRIADFVSQQSRVVMQAAADVSCG